MLKGNEPLPLFTLSWLHTQPSISEFLEFLCVIHGCMHAALLEIFLLEDEELFTVLLLLIGKTP